MFFSVHVFGQQAEQIHLKKFTQADGLSSYNIRDIIQDKNGFIWIATQDGLNRFNGNAFTSYTKSATLNRRICGVDIRRIIEDTSRNLLWTLPAENGINAIDIITGDVIKTIPLPYKNAEEWAMSMNLNNDNLWIGTYNGIYVYDIKKNKVFTINVIAQDIQKNSSQFQAREILNDNFGNVWVCFNGYGIVVFDQTTFKVVKRIPRSLLNDYLGNSDLRFTGYAFLKPTEMLFSTSQGLRRIEYDKNYNIQIDNSPSKILNKINSEDVESVLKVAPDGLLIASHDGLYKVDSALSRFSQISEIGNTSESNWIQSVQCIYQDKNKNLWLGCEQGLGFTSLLPYPFRSYYYDEITKQKLEHIRSLYVLRNGDILAGLRNGLAFINSVNGKFTIIDTPHLYHHIFIDKNNLIHVDRDDGMFIFIHGALSPIINYYPEFKNYSSCSINSTAFLDDTTIVLGTENDNGILFWNYKKHTVNKIDKNSHLVPLKSNIVNNTFLDKRNNLWVLSDNTITIIDNNHSPKYLEIEEPNKKFNLYFDICEAKGYYWIASYGNGIIQLDSNFNFKRLLSSNSGLSNDGVYNIYNIGDSDLIITTNNGLSVYSLNTNKFSKYYKEDGLHSNSFEEVASVNTNDKIYAGGVNGFTVIDPSKFTTNTVPPVFYYTNIQTKTKDSLLDTSNLLLTKLKIPSTWLQTNISFVGINYLNPTRVTYQYRIKQRDKNWINLGTQNFIDLIGLNPGTYTLEVKVANEDGYWSQPKQLTLIFLPKWYQTLLFKMLVVAAILAIPFAFYRYRLSNIKKQHQIRQSISNDLHDDIGATLNSVKLFTHLAQMQPEKNDYFKQITSSLEQASMGLRDMIWILDDSRDSTSDFINRVKQFAIPATNASNINIEFDIDSNAKEDALTKEEKRNLYLITKEAINNSIKYSGCSKIFVGFKGPGKNINLTIQDNGKGFDENQIIRGNGLNNISLRAKQISCIAKIYSSLNNGTSIFISKK
jgi:ligand-binding sensor domain-containing protein/two-component sensor histidine kinase